MTDKQPIVLQRADPRAYRHTDGYYYFTGSVPGYQTIELRRAKTLAGLADGEVLTVWHAHASGPQSQLIWAPEIHYINGKWYIYFAASDSATERTAAHHHRMFVLECAAADPMTTDWTDKGQIVTAQDSFSLDATVFEHNGDLYYLWAQLEPAIHNNSNLYLSKMANPWTLTGKQTLLSVPEYDWETIGFAVNEGPAVLQRNGKVFVTYSASATDEHYAWGCYGPTPMPICLTGLPGTRQANRCLRVRRRITCMAQGTTALPPYQTGRMSSCTMRGLTTTPVSTAIRWRIQTATPMRRRLAGLTTAFHNLANQGTTRRQPCQQSR